MAKNALGADARVALKTGLAPTSASASAPVPAPSAQIDILPLQIA